jgi:acyl-CoA synthetase (AMP-forming)/AMP-acid ligase II
MSGGENISSVEVESAVLEAAVVAMPHPHWGETPCAFLSLREGASQVKEEEIVSFCRGKIARFMVPKKVVFVDQLPRNSTGKVQKLLLRERARALAANKEQHLVTGSRL